MLLAVSGFKGSGKSTVGDILVEQYGFVALSFAEPVYQGVWELNPWICINYNFNKFQRLQGVVADVGWDKAKRSYADVRRSLEAVGAEIGRDIIGVNTWVNILDSKMKDLPVETDVVITDVRFPNEDGYVHDKGGSLWRVTRPGVGLEGDHVSERNQKDLRIDYTVRNSGDKATLYERVAEALEWERDKVKS